MMRMLTQTQTVPVALVSYACQSHGVRETHCLAVNDHETVSPGVSGLFLHGGPSAIVRVVACIVVDALYRVSWRRRISHVSVEGFKGLPVIAYGDASSAVARKARDGSQFATSPHVLPDAVGSAARQAMYTTASGTQLGANAAARCCQSAPDVVYAGSGLSAAVALAQHLGVLLAMFVRIDADHGQLAVSLADSRKISHSLSLPEFAE